MWHDAGREPGAQSAPTDQFTISRLGALRCDSTGGSAQAVAQRFCVCANEGNRCARVTPNLHGGRPDRCVRDSGLPVARAIGERRGAGSCDHQAGHRYLDVVTAIEAVAELGEVSRLLTRGAVYERCVRYAAFVGVYTVPCLDPNR